MTRNISLAIALLIVCIPQISSAHTRSQSFSSWNARGNEVTTTFNIKARLVTALRAIESTEPTLGQQLSKHLADTISLSHNGTPCNLISPPRPVSAESGFTRVEMHFSCPQHLGSGVLTVNNDAFFLVASSHLHFARLTSPGRSSQELVFSSGRQSLSATLETSGEATSNRDAASPSQYVGLGIEHILAGWDHLAFLLGLLLLCRRLRDVVIIITGFTLGHSLTLTLAVLGVVDPNVPVIETLIGFTVALVAAESVAINNGLHRAIAVIGPILIAGIGIAAWMGHGALTPMVCAGLVLFTACYGNLVQTHHDAIRLAPVLTVVFGLVHGFGFADVLLDVGLPTDRLVPALFGFNVGVELGQLAIVTVIWGLTHKMKSHLTIETRHWMLDGTAAALAGLGIFWFASRALW